MGKNVYWLYSILVDGNAHGSSKNELMEKLAENGIEAKSFFHPLHTMPLYKKYAKTVNSLHQKKFPQLESTYQVS